MRSRLLSFLVVLGLLGGLGATAARGAVEFGPGGENPIDVRRAAAPLGPTRAQGDAIVSLAEEHPDVTLRWNGMFGTPSTMLRHGGTLSDAAAGTPEDVARDWLARHAAVFGWGAADAAALRHVRSLAQPDGGPKIVLFHQPYGGLEGGSLGGTLTVALDGSNRILSVRANVTRGTALASGGDLSADDAFSAATGVAAPEIVGTRAGWTEFARGDLGGPHYARRAAFPLGDGAARPAWEVLYAERLDEGYRVVVDAATGDVLYRRPLALDVEPPRGTIFRNYPGAPRGGEPEQVSFAGDPDASPSGWLSPISPEVPAPTTVGNNAHTATNWAVFIAPDGGQLRPVEPDASFDAQFTDAWNRSDCGANPISTGPGDGAPDSPTYAEDALPAVTNLFYHHNLMHDYFWHLGFTEAAGNMQVRNFGRGGEEGDPLLGLAQAGALGGDAPLYLGRDNAYMFPMPDGIPPWSGMFIWEPIPLAFLAPCVDGDFDAAVIYHEYTHGVTTRWVGAEFGNLDSFQGGAMGEAWSDFYALHYLQTESGVEDRDVLGPYVTGNEERGIRNWGLSEVPVGFGDIGYDTAGDQVHADGQIWSGTLWDLREALAEARPDGAEYAARIIADAMPAAGPLPSMLDMRDAILAADLARTGGANQDLLWSVFARRGMGASAMTSEILAADDTNPTPGFDHVDDARNGMVAARLVDAVTADPVAGAKIIVGEYEARVTPVARTGQDGSFGFPIQAGSFPLTVQARGYGARTLSLSVGPGRTLEAVIKLKPNLASIAAGAEVVETSNPSTLGRADLALNDSEVNAWWTDEDDDGPQGEWFVVDLAGADPVKVAELQVSAFNTPGHRFEALRDFRVLASTDGSRFTEILHGTFQTSPPRPVTPDLHHRQFRLPRSVPATHLKFVAVAPQDDDAPTVQVAEVQAFGAGHVVIEPPSGGTEQPVTDEGIALVPTADAILTRRVMQRVCVFPPPTQGIDAWVTELPDAYGDGTHTITVIPESEVPQVRADVDVYFLSPDCRPTGSIATASAGESGTIPQGTRYVVTELYTSYLTSILVEARPGP